MIHRLLGVLFALCLLTGCGEEAGGDGNAQLWVTRDRGREVLLTASIPAGISALEALRREADVDTRYGGRFVNSVNGVEGDVSRQRDWFWFVNGYEGDRSAADYRLHAGDVVWWDHRSWAGQMREPVVVGAFPEPFVHGWGGERRPAVVEGAAPQLRRRLASLITPEDAAGEPNRLVVVDGAGLRARLEGSPGDPVVVEVGRDLVERLLEDASFARYRYAIP